jgi:predicted CXXCH cytochrome family protein
VKVVAMARSKRAKSNRAAVRKLPVARPVVESGNAGVGRSRLRTMLIAAAAIVVLAAAGGLAFQLLDLSAADTFRGTDAALAFVGNEACAGCHRSEAELWRSSHHRLAMQHADDTSVRGDFHDASFDYYGVHSSFFRRDGKYLVETDGPDGRLASFEVKYTFGVEPLQQYLVEFPGGRLQALPLAWDSRPKEQGGQRWFHLYPNEEIKHDDLLHWTRLNQNWNFMCAECHSTGVRKNYDAAGDRFATTWAEIDVGCEACHGQGSRHIAWVRARQSWWPFGKNDDPSKGLLVRFDERQDVRWSLDPSTGNSSRSFKPALLRKEVETCGLCHARGAKLSEDWIPGRPLSDTHLVSLLARGLYQPDGQMLDEVYNYGSFKQSRMFAAGVTCSDCHEPHAAKLRLPGDGVCLQCHSADKYAVVAHHHHEGADPPVGCASCHMPSRTYMVVDRRHDHSLRIPRPDLSETLGTPNACNDCHSEKTPAWAASAIERWHGPSRKGFQNYSEAFHAAWTEQADAAGLLAAVAANSAVPDFARASALAELQPHLDPSTIKLARAGLTDPDPLMRIGALDMLDGVPANQLWPLVAPLLSDSSRGVRIRAAALLAALATSRQPPADRERFEHAAAEFIAAQRLNADRPESRSALGSFYAQRGRAAEAEAEFRAALRLSPQHAPAAINLADLYRQLGRDSEGETVLRTAIAASPRDAGLHYALGLTLTRLKRSSEAIAQLQRATELEPDRARYQYVFAVALHSAGRTAEAVAVLTDALAKHAQDRDILTALATINRDQGNIAAALEFAERLARLAPGDPGPASLVDELRRRAGSVDVR